jgi:hypothetical protein
MRPKTPSSKSGPQVPDMRPKTPSSKSGPQVPDMRPKTPKSTIKNFAKGGSTASKRGDGCATKGKTKGRFV